MEVYNDEYLIEMLVDMLAIKRRMAAALTTNEKNFYEYPGILEDRKVEAYNAGYINGYCVAWNSITGEDLEPGDTHYPTPPREKSEHLWVSNLPSQSDQIYGVLTNLVQIMSHCYQIRHELKVGLETVSDEFFIYPDLVDGILREQQDIGYEDGFNQGIIDATDYIEGGNPSIKLYTPIITQNGNTVHIRTTGGKVKYSTDNSTWIDAESSVATLQVNQSMTIYSYSYSGQDRTSTVSKSIVYDTYIDMPLTFEMLESGSISCLISPEENQSSTYYKINNGEWVQFNNLDEYREYGRDWIIIGYGLTINNLSVGDRVSFKAEYGCKVYCNYSCNVYGNLFSIVGYRYYGTDSFTIANKIANAINGHIVSAANLRLPAEKLEENMYKGLFKNCTTLTAAPALPALLLERSCYEEMFYGCTSLTTAPELPATKLAIGCYQKMFYGCTSLVYGPSVIPALDVPCSIERWDEQRHTWTWTGMDNSIGAPWAKMFHNCSSLTTPPEFWAENFTVGPNNGCGAFEHIGNHNVTSLKCMSLEAKYVCPLFDGGILPTSSSFTLVMNIENPYDWVGSNFAGTLKYASHKIITGIEINPSTYTLQSPGNAQFAAYVRFKDGSGVEITNNRALVWSSSSNKLVNEGGGYFTTATQSSDSTATVSASIYINDIQYTASSTVTIKASSVPYSQRYYTIVNMDPNSTNGNIWMPSGSYYSKNGGDWEAIPSNAYGISGVAYGDEVKIKTTNWVTNNRKVHTDFTYKVFGNIMSLAYGESFASHTDTIQLQQYYSGDSYIIDAENLILPSTTANNYQYMFSGCTNLVKAPSLPATTLGQGCYRYMFKNCISLTSVPSLQATTLAQECYLEMFYGCTSLVNAPALNATTLAEDCYVRMFQGCTSLVNAPSLPATDLLPGPATPSYGIYAGMFQGCTSLVNAPALPATTLAKCCYLRMFSGCTSLVTAPDLLATNLPDRCYYHMFDGCTNLNSVKCLATSLYYNVGESTPASTLDWLNGVSASGTFTKNSSMSSWPTGNSGIPSGWTIQNAT